MLGVRRRLGSTLEVLDHETEDLPTNGRPLLRPSPLEDHRPLGRAPAGRLRAHRHAAAGRADGAVQLLRQARLAGRRRPALASAWACRRRPTRSSSSARRPRRRRAPPSAQTVLGIQDRIAALGPGVVDSVVSAFKGGSPAAMISANGHTAIIPIVMAGDVAQAEQEHRQGARHRARRQRRRRLSDADHRHRQHQLAISATRRPPTCARARASACRSPSIILLIVFGTVVAAEPADLPGADRHHAGRGAHRDPRPPVQRVDLRGEHDHPDRPGRGHRLLAVHRVALSRGAGPRSLDDRRGGGRGRHGRPRRLLQRHDGRARAAAPCCSCRPTSSSASAPARSWWSPWRCSRRSRCCRPCSACSGRASTG